MEWFDTHAHLYAEDFGSEQAELVKRAEAASVTRIVTQGVNEETNRLTIQYAEKFPTVFAAVGWQPTDLDLLKGATELSAAQLAELKEQALHPKTVAIGEIGLDYFRLPRRETERTEAIKIQQRNVFRQQLELAAELDLPCCIHQRGEGTLQDCLEILRPFTGKLRAVFHCFVGSEEDARTFFELGHIISITGIVTFKKAEELRETLRLLPSEKMMVETDSPYLAPEPFFRRRCEPAYVVHTGVRLAGILGISPEEFARQTCYTARKFFKKLT